MPTSTPHPPGNKSTDSSILVRREEFMTWVSSPKVPGELYQQALWPLDPDFCLMAPLWEKPMEWEASADKEECPEEKRWLQGWCKQGKVSIVHCSFFFTFPHPSYFRSNSPQRIYVSLKFLCNAEFALCLSMTGNDVGIQMWGAIQLYLGALQVWNKQWGWAFIIL